MRTQLVVVSVGVVMVVAAGGAALAAGLRGGSLGAAVGATWLVIATLDVFAFRRARDRRQTVPRTAGTGWPSARSVQPPRPPGAPEPEAPVEAPSATASPAAPSASTSAPVEPAGPPPREWNLWELERLTREREDPAELSVEHGALLLHLRTYANAEGALPIEFDGLVRESFKDVLASADRDAGASKLDLLELRPRVFGRRHAGVPEVRKQDAHLQVHDDRRHPAARWTAFPTQARRFHVSQVDVEVQTGG